MGEIAAASEEQSGGIEQVARAVNQMDEVTQQNAALVEEAAAAAQSLEDQAGKLRTAVAVFQLEEGAFEAPVAQTARRPAARPAVRKAAASPRPRASTARPAAMPVAASAATAAPARSPAPGKAPVPAAAGGDNDWETF
jgi:methyl-accepting chemotaxis protein I, serine sensor receptor